MIRAVAIAIAAAPLTALLVVPASGVFAETPRKSAAVKTEVSTADSLPAGHEQATFATGCFWCSEAVFQQLKGVSSVVSGYSGGHVKNPTYYQVSSGLTGHAEAVEITFDPKVITYTELLEVFWRTHDPTTPNRQGVDVGPQYRSAIFYHSLEQKRLAEEWKQKLDAEHAFEQPIVTEIAPFVEFYPAEDYHQDYFKVHRRQPYCVRVIKPKVNEVKKIFRDKLKSAKTQ